MDIFLNFPNLSGYQAKSLPIFDLEICEEENHLAVAILLVKAGETLPDAGTEALIEDGAGSVHFKGFLSGAPKKIEGDFAQIELLAKPKNFKESLENLQKESRCHPFWDPLWVRPDKRDDFEEIQEVRTACLYCDRKTGRLSWSDWFKEEGELTKHIDFFEESVVMKVKKVPLQACTVKVHVNWIQQERGIANLGPSLRKAFPHSYVSTYTKKSLEKKWPSPGKRLGKSGVWVIKSKLKPFYPAFPFLPRFSKPLFLGEKTEGQQSYRL